MRTKVAITAGAVVILGLVQFLPSGRKEPAIPKEPTRPIERRMLYSKIREELPFRDSLPLNETIRRVRAGEVPPQTVRAIYAILQNTKEVEIHRMRGAVENQVYLSPDGRRESVYDASGRLVKDGINDGSFNYAPADRYPLGHFTYDIAPWILQGSSPTDPTSRRERVHAYAADIFAGVARARQRGIGTDTPAGIDDELSGAAEAIAIFVLAIESGGAQRMIDIIGSEEEVSDEQLVKIVQEFEDGLQEVFAPEADPPDRPQR